MDYELLAQKLFPHITETPDDVLARYPQRELPEGAKVSASRHENGWWAMSFTLPGSFLQEIYGKQLSSGGIVKGNFYKCDETIHPHFGTWNRVVAPQPDFHRPECFGEMQVEA